MKRESLNTTLVVPVDDVTPVPPFAICEEHKMTKRCPVCFARENYVICKNHHNNIEMMFSSQEGTLFKMSMTKDEAECVYNELGQKLNKNT